MKFKTQNIIILFFVIVFSIPMLWAQESEKMDSIFHLEDVCITAQYKPTHYKSVVHNVAILKEADLIKRGVTTLDQALATLPMIRLEHDPILGAQIRFRGISARNVAILLDGIPIVGRLDGGIDLSQVPLQNILRIEVVEGPLSNIYGNNAAGGVINIITKKQLVNTINFNSQHQYESIGNLNNQASLGFKSGKWQTTMQGRLFEYNQYPVDSLRLLESYLLDNGTLSTRPVYPWNPKKQYSYGATVGYQIDNNNSFLLKYNNAHELLTDYGAVKRPQYKPYAEDVIFNTLRRDVALLYDGELGNKYYVDVNLGYNYFNRTNEEQKRYLETNTIDSIYHPTDTTTFKAIFMRTNIAKAINEKTELIVGTSYNKEIGMGDKIIDHSEKADSTTAKFYEIAPYVELKYKVLPSLLLSASGRMTFHSSYKDKFTSALHVKYDWNKKWSLRGSIAQGYRSPDLKELYIEFIDVNHFILGNSNLMPEISTDFQSTLSYQHNNYISTSLNGFYTNIAHRISLVEYETLKFQYQNIDKYDAYGANLSIDVKYKNFQSSTSASVQYWSTGINNESAPSFGKVVDLNQTLSYNWAKLGTQFNVNFRHQGKQPLYSVSNSVVTTKTVDAINFVDASISKSLFKSKIQLIGGARNILDIKTSNVSNPISNHTASDSRQVSQGRSLFVTLRVSL